MSIIQAIAEEFQTYEHSVLRCDRGEMFEQDTWGIDEEFSAEDIVDRIKECTELRQDNEELWIPLHKEESADLTGEYVILRRKHGDLFVFYQDVGRGKLTPVRPSILGSVYVGYRMRFWHEGFDPPEPPEFLADVEEDKSPVRTTSVEISAENPASKEDMDQLYDELVELVEENRSSAREEERDSISSTSMRELKRQGDAVDSLTKKGLVEVGRETLTLKAESEQQFDLEEGSDIRTGMEVAVGMNRDEPGFPFDASIYKVFSDGVRVKPKWSTIDSPESMVDVLDDGASVDLSILLDPLPFERKLDAIDDVWRDEDKRGVIGGRSLLEMDSDLSVDFDGSGLNRYQKMAARKALRSKDVFCIHGPPGTGKSRTLAAIVREAVEEGKRVLVTAHSNQAVDNLLTSDLLHQADLKGELEIARPGHNIKEDVVKSRFADRSEKRADVVGTTTSRCAHYSKDEFDLCVIDEATQADIPSTLLPFFCSKQLVLAGDHKQLPPHCSDEDMRRDEMHRPLFERLLETYDDGVSVTLRRQYRMNAAISRFPSDQFYGGDLEDAEQNSDWTIADLNPVKAIDVRKSEERRGDSWANSAEAKAAVSQVQRLLNRDVPKDEIGVIAMYSGQVDEIRKKLRSHGIYGVEVSTVDSYQGSEKEAIVVSFVRSNFDKDAGFLEYGDEGKRRLNVAITRAKKRCVLIGNWKTLSRVSDRLEPSESCAAVYAALYEYLQDNGYLVSPSSAPVAT